MGCNLWFDTDLYSASLNNELYEISCYIGLRYNSIWLYVTFPSEKKIILFWNLYIDGLMQQM